MKVKHLFEAAEPSDSGGGLDNAEFLRLVNLTPSPGVTAVFELIKVSRGLQARGLKVGQELRSPGRYTGGQLVDPVSKEIFKIQAKFLKFKRYEKLKK